jgi:hypothetical protein
VDSFHGQWTHKKADQIRRLESIVSSCPQPHYYESNTHVAPLRPASDPSSVNLGPLCFHLRP